MALSKIDSGSIDAVTADKLDYSLKVTDVNVVRRNGQTITTDFTIASDENGLSAGPITQNATVTVNGYWSIV
jgi:hypothetical protein